MCGGVCGSVCGSVCSVSGSACGSVCGSVVMCVVLCVVVTVRGGGGEVRRCVVSKNKNPTLRMWGTRPVIDVSFFDTLLF